MMNAMMSGSARLAYVVIEQKGKVRREVTTWTKEDGLTKKTVEQPAGYLVFFPRGHVLRMNAQQLKHYQLDKKPRIINLEGLSDPNSTVGKLMYEQDEKLRAGAFTELENFVIQLATARTGPIVTPEQVRAQEQRAAA